MPAPSSSPLLEDCFGDNTTWGVRTLSALRQWQQEEFQEHERRRSPPYVYTLCPGNFEVTNDDPLTVIQPLLDQTIVACATKTPTTTQKPNDQNHELQAQAQAQEQAQVEQQQQQQEEPQEPEQDNKCYIRSSSWRLPHVLLAPPASSSSSSTTLGETNHHQRNHTTFMDLEFRDSKLLSIAAWDSDSTSVSFVRCHWKDNDGFGLISNAWNGASSPGTATPGTPAAMKVHLESCILTGTRAKQETTLSFLVASTAGTVTMTDTIIRANTAQVLFYGDSSHFEISKAYIHLNNAIDGFYLQSSTAIVEDSTFRRNKFLLKGPQDKVPSGSSVVAFDSTLNISSTDFMENKAFVDLIVQDESMVSLNHVAFMDGRYRLAPAYVANGNTIYTDSHILAKAQGGTCREHFFRAYRQDSCLSMERVTDCRGTCQPFPSRTNCENTTDAHAFCQNINSVKCLQLAKLNGTKRRIFWSCPKACGVCT